MPILSLNKIGEKSFFVCEPSTIEFLLAYSFRKMFIIGQNSKHVHVTCFSKNFDLLLINSNRYLSLIFHFIKEMLYVNTYYK